MKTRHLFPSLLGLLLPFLAPAAVVDFTGSAVSASGTQSALQLTTSGTYGGATDYFPNSAAFAVAVDDTNLTLTYNSIAVQVPGFTTSNTVLFTTGLGQTTSVTTSITFDAFTILYTGTQALALTGGYRRKLQHRPADHSSLWLAGPVRALQRRRADADGDWKFCDALLRGGWKCQ